MVSRLLELPAELRAMIFEHLWNASMQDAMDQEPTWHRTVSVFVDCYPKILQQLSSPRPRPMVPMHVLPAWLRTCKAFSNEAIELVVRGSLVHVGSIMSGSDVDKDGAEATFVRHGACKLGSYEYVTSSSYDKEGHDCKDWYARSGLPGILAPCSPRRLVAQFPAPSFTLISPLEPWLEDEIAICRQLFWAISETNGIRDWKFTFDCAATPSNDEAKVELLHLGLLLQGIKSGLDRLEVRFALGRNNNPSGDELMALQSALWEELHSLKGWATQGFQIGLKDGVKEARMHVEEKLHGWNIVWIRCTEGDGT